GGVRSRLIPGRTVDARLPARSTATPVALCARPSSANQAAGEHSAMPDRSSWQSKPTASDWLYQPAAFEGGTSALMRGGERSTLIPLTVADTWLPAASVALPVADWPTPSLASVTGLV